MRRNVTPGACFSLVDLKEDDTLETGRNIKSSSAATYPPAAPTKFKRELQETLWVQPTYPRSPMKSEAEFEDQLSSCALYNTVFN